jgi:DNA-binding NarL/FixJ family response regulator
MAAGIPYVYPVKGRNATRAFNDPAFAVRVRPADAPAAGMLGRRGDCPVTVRELEIVAALTHGGGRQAAAERVGLSELTVKSHLQNIKAKLRPHIDSTHVDIGDTAAVVIECLRNRWIEIVPGLCAECLTRRGRLIPLHAPGETGTASPGDQPE